METMTVEKLAIFCASRIFPNMLNHRLGLDLGLTQIEALSFLEYAVSRNAYTKAEVVLGCTFSSLVRMRTDMVRQGTNITWSRIKERLEHEYQTLRKSERVWNEYCRFFYELVTTYIAQNFTSILIRKFCTYLRFEGSMTYDDDAMRDFLYRTGLSSDFATLNSFLHREDNYAMLPERYRDEMVNRVSYLIYDLTQAGSSSFRGGPPELLRILKGIHDTMNTLPANLPYEVLAKKYPHADTQTNPIQANLDAIISGILRDICQQKFTLTAPAEAA